MRSSVRFGLVSLFALGLALPAIGAFVPWRHDPRTTAKKLSQGLEVDGAGKIALDYKALHFNAQMYENAKQREGYMNMLNANVWGKLGTAKLGFDLTAGDVKLPAGDYQFGINMTKDDKFSVVFWSGPEFKEKKVLPLNVEKEAKEVGYLTVALMATDAVDTFTLEARCGPYRGTVDVKVPYLGEKHEHPDGK